MKKIWRCFLSAITIFSRIVYYLSIFWLFDLYQEIRRSPTAAGMIANLLGWAAAFLIAVPLMLTLADCPMSFRTGEASSFADLRRQSAILWMPQEVKLQGSDMAYAVYHDISIWQTYICGKLSPDSIAQLEALAGRQLITMEDHCDNHIKIQTWGYALRNAGRWQSLGIAAAANGTAVSFLNPDQTRPEKILYFSGFDPYFELYVNAATGGFMMFISYFR